MRLILTALIFLFGLFDLFMGIVFAPMAVKSLWRTSALR